jgi:hypothetical protein
MTAREKGPRGRYLDRRDPVPHLGVASSRENLTALAITQAARYAGWGSSIVGSVAGVVAIVGIVAVVAIRHNSRSELALRGNWLLWKVQG